MMRGVVSARTAPGRSTANAPPSLGAMPGTGSEGDDCTLSVYPSEPSPTSCTLGSAATPLFVTTKKEATHAQPRARALPRPAGRAESTTSVLQLTYRCEGRDGTRVAALGTMKTELKEAPHPTGVPPAPMFIAA